MAASRDTLTDTLAKLEANGVIERVPPRRPKPQYALTALGQAVGAHCQKLVDMVNDNQDVFPVALKKWPMLVVVALGRGATRYNEAKAALPGITARALALALKDLQGIDLIQRTVEHTYPPAPTYVLSARGRYFFGPLDELCQAAAAATARSETEGRAK